MSLLTCPLCGEEQDAGGAAVSSWRDDDGNWASRWVPFIEDLRGTPERLVHPHCYVSDAGLESLLRLIRAHDLRTRVDLTELWRIKHLEDPAR